MFFRYRTKAFVFKKELKGEGDELFTLYTKDFGRLEVLAKGIKKIKSKLRGSIDLFCLSEIEFVQGKIYKTLTDAVLIEKFENIRKNLLKLKLVFAMSELMDNFLIEQERDERLWELLIKTLYKIKEEKTKSKLVKVLYFYFFWNLVTILGYKPELYSCSFCQKKIKPEKIYFSSREGGLICFDCLEREEGAIKIKPGTVKILRILIEKDLSFLEKLKFENEYFKDLELVTKNFFPFLLKKKI